MLTVSFDLNGNTPEPELPPPPDRGWVWVGVVVLVGWAVVLGVVLWNKEAIDKW